MGNELSQEVKIGEVGKADFSEALAGEKAEATVAVGPLEIGVVVKIDNKKLLNLVASKLPGGLMHEAVIMLEKALFPVA